MPEDVTHAVDETHFRRAIDKLPSHRRFKAIVGSELYSLTQEFFSRSEELSRWGIRSHAPLGNCFDEAFRVSVEEKEEESKARLVEIAIAVCQGSYWNKFLDDERSRDIDQRLQIVSASGRQWEAGLTSLDRRIAKLMEEKPADYFSRYLSVIAAIRSARDSELSDRLFCGDAGVSASAGVISERERIVRRALENIGFRLKSARAQVVYVSQVASRQWQVQIQYDREKLNRELAIDTSGEKQIGIFEVMFGMTGSAMPARQKLPAIDSNILLRFDQFFPISRHPIADVFSSFRSLEELVLVVNAKLKMFSALHQPLENAFGKGIEKAEADERNRLD